MELENKKIRLYVKYYGRYGTVLEKDLKDTTQATITVVFHRNTSDKKDSPVYELIEIKEISRRFLK